ncbi:MAG: hypothetical protein AAB426_01360 [Myxococcota bacterium]
MAAQDAQLLRDDRRLYTEMLGQGTDVFVTLSEQSHDSQAKGVRDSLEHIGGARGGRTISNQRIHVPAAS